MIPAERRLLEAPGLVVRREVEVRPETGLLRPGGHSKLAMEFEGNTACRVPHREQSEQACARREPA